MTMRAAGTTICFRSDRRVLLRSALHDKPGVHSWFPISLVQPGRNNDIFERTPLLAARAHGDGGMCALQSLVTGHFIGRQHPLTDREHRRRLLVERRDVGHFLRRRCIGLRIQPVATCVRLEIGLIVKNAPRDVPR